jgi:hypothetical protein
LGSDPLGHSSDVPPNLIGLFLGKLSHLVLDPILGFEDLRNLAKRSVRVGKVQPADHSNRSGMVLSAPALSASLDRKGVARGDYAVHAQESDSVPRFIGRRPVHLSLELAGTFEIDAIPVLGKDFGPRHELAFPTNVEPFVVDRFHERRISSVFGFRPGVDKRGNGVPEPVPNPGSDLI